MPASLETIDTYLADNSDRFLEELKNFLRIPSVSADSRHKGDVRRAAEFVMSQFRGAGLTAELVETAGHPICYGHWLKAPGAPTVLIYGHYDVQPPDPLDKWITSPFEPTVRDGCLFARGATDDKGQVFTHLKSIEAWMKTTGSLPVNVKFVIEGEEEVGSNNLDLFLASNASRLTADVAVISDTAQYAPGIPAITYGLRGILSCEVRLTGPRQDLHSGVFGGAIANPATGLGKVIGMLHDDKGRIQIPGFYDDIPPLAPAERQMFAALPFDESQFLMESGAADVWGETGYTTQERRCARPTCDVNGIVGGYIGTGPKTIIPAWATAKITCRLVPNQNPGNLMDSLESFVRSHCRPGLHLEFSRYHQSAGIVFDFNSRYMVAARKAIAAAFGVEPVMIREGGSIPVVATFQSLLGLDTLLLGWGQNTDNLHGPNEHFHLADFRRGTRASAHLWHELAVLS